MYSGSYFAIIQSELATFNLKHFRPLGKYVHAWCTAGISEDEDQWMVNVVIS